MRVIGDLPSVIFLLGPPGCGANRLMEQLTDADSGIVIGDAKAALDSLLDPMLPPDAAADNIPQGSTTNRTYIQIFDSFREWVIENFGENYHWHLFANSILHDLRSNYDTILIRVENTEQIRIVANEIPRLTHATVNFDRDGLPPYAPPHPDISTTFTLRSDEADLMQPFLNLFS